jgi:hypothetical protein
MLRLTKTGVKRQNISFGVFRSAHHLPEPEGRHVGDAFAFSNAITP